MIQPAIGIARVHRNVARGNHQESVALNIRERIDFITATRSQGAAAEKKKRHVCSQSGCDRQQSLASDSPFYKPEQPCQSRGGIARTASQPPSRWDALLQNNAQASRRLGLAK